MGSDKVKSVLLIVVPLVKATKQGGGGKALPATNFQ